MTVSQRVEVRDGARERVAALRAALEHVSHLVPAQNPLDRFVHHNPLHTFEALSFDAAVVEASAVYDNEPYWAEESYREAWRSGRIQDADLTWILAREIDASERVGELVTRRAMVRALMIHPIEPLGGESLDWTLTETDALRALRADLTSSARAALVSEAGGDEARAVQQLWAVCDSYRGLIPDPPAPALRSGSRVRDVMARAGQDPDAWVEPVMIRWCAAFLDHGVSYWGMSDREQGFLAAFLAHIKQPLDLGRPWLAPLRGLARDGEWDATRLSCHLLELLGHPVSTWGAVVQETLLALRGWSGMFQRLADRPDTAPEALGLPTALEDVLAVRLALDWCAAEWLLRDTRGDDLLSRAHALPVAPSPQPTSSSWLLFHLCQTLGVSAHTLSELGAIRVIALTHEALGVSELSRRRLWHEAYERRFRVETLDAVAAHARSVADRPAAAPRVQCVFCIDDREESLRRLLEEQAPWIKTYGVAGNYGISMYYKGLEHGHPVALGPAGFKPDHLVSEIPVGEPQPRSRWRGLLQHHLNLSAHTAGGAVVALGGAASALPLSLRLLAPRLHARLTRRPTPAETSLRFERGDGDERDAHGLLPGFTVHEMTDIVAETLEMMSMVRDFSPLVICFGHGSRSMNNPHEAAHDCGACGGGRGGPNARVFARMANDPRVRARLVERGIVIPEGTRFVGGYHNTADDAVDLYDLTLIPETHRELLAETRTSLDSARALDALERCRKFENVPLSATPEDALLHVENRDEDLAQPRPEYGHCTNAICFVGRREWSRGLFLDRRAFLCSYDPAVDPEGSILSRLLAMVVPVGAGINLEYWFSVVDPAGYGSGTKLPHNITGLIGVMDGHQSDLRTGLPWQMVEIHEPVRLLCVVEASPAALLRVAEEQPAVGRLVTNSWVQLASLDPATGELWFFEDGDFKPWEPERQSLPGVSASLDWFRGARGLLPAASVRDEGGAS